MVLSLLRSRWEPWIRKITCSVTDQALISGSNFLLSVLLARWLEPVEYGVYALGFAGYLLMLSFFQALIIEPLCVFGPSDYSANFHNYLGTVLRVQGLLAVAQCVLFGFGALLCLVIPSWREGAGALIGLAIACPLILGFASLRSATYIALSGSAAVKAAVIYCVALVVSVLLARRFNFLNAGSAFLIMGFASAAVSFQLLQRLRPTCRDTGLSALAVAKEHWSFGRWELSRVGVDWITENIAYAVVASLLGIAQVGALKALTTLFLPLSHILTALRRIILPYLSKTAYASGGHERIGKSVKLLAALYGAGTLVYGVCATLAAPWLVSMLYHNKFPEVVSLVPLFAFALLFSVPVHVLDMGLRAVRLPKAVFVSSSLASASPILLSWPIIWFFGLRGAVGGSLLTSAIFLTCMGWSLKNKLAQEAQRTAAVGAGG